MIKNLIFDMGNIFVDLDEKHAISLLHKAGINWADLHIIEHNQAYEKGLVSTEKHINFYQKHIPNLSKDEFIAAWNSVFVAFPAQRFQFLQNIANTTKYNLFLLSNTNEIHINWLTANISFFEEFRTLFKKFYLSHEIYLRKPDHSIYEFVIENAHINPKESLFIDDLLINTKAAEDLGFKTWNLIPGKQDITQLFEIKKHILQS